MYQPKYPKKNFRNPRNNSDQRERESSPHQRVAWARTTLPRSRTAWVLLWVLSDEFLVWPGFFFDEFFSYGSRAAWVFFFFSLLCSSLMWVFITVINRVLETRFSCSCHVEKMPHQTWLGHGNRVFETRFID